jgi:hypothetical protein
MKYKNTDVKEVLLALGYVLICMSTILFLGFMFGCGTDFKRQDKCGFLQNKHGERVTADLPIKLYISTTVPDRYFNSIQLAINTWSIPISKWAFQIVDYEYNGTKNSQDGKNVIYIFYDRWDFSATYTGVTRRYQYGNKAIESDIMFNAFIFNFSLDPTDKEMDFESVLVHELGHALGLDHTSGTIMDAYLVPGEIRRDLTQTDIDNIQCGYLGDRR